MFSAHKNYNIKFCNFLICFYPVSYAIGNLAINLNTVLIIIAGFLTFKYEIFKIPKNFINILIAIFFFYILLITSINYIPILEDDSLQKDFFLKSIFYFRYLLLFLVVSKFIEKNLLDLKLFYILSSILVIFLCVDLIFQAIIGFDIFGYKAIAARRLSGFFGEELIAGTYLQKFSLFLIFLLPVYFKNLNFKNNLLISFFSVSFIIAMIILTGNRMPLILFMISVILFCIVEKRFWKISTIFLSAFLITSIVIVNLYKPAKYGYLDFFAKSKEIIIYFPKIFSEEIYINFSNHRLKIFNAAVKTWQKSKIYGAGLKSFKINCEGHTVNTICSYHPHNYYLEFMMDLGLVGLALIVIIFLSVFIIFLRSYLLNKDLSLREKLILIPPFLIFFTEIFPVKSSGSFYTTGNSTIFFIFLAITLNSHIFYKNLKSKE